MRAWRVRKSEYLLKRRWLSLRVEEVETARGVVLPEYHVIEAMDWVCVVALTTDHNLVLVRQYRHGFGGTTLELPAGALDEGEEPVAAARREFLEETGYDAPEWRHLLTASPETTRHGHRVHCFLACGAKRVASQSLDESEDVEVCLRPALDVGLIIGELNHAVHIAALLLAERSGAFGSSP